MDDDPPGCASPPCFLAEQEPRIALRRACEPARPEDGRRVLVERLWPRGVTRAALAAEWRKDLAPSPELRRWHGHDPARWEAFRSRYLAELSERPEAVATLLAACRAGPVALVFAAKDPERSSAAVLRAHLLALALTPPGDPSPSG